MGAAGSGLVRNSTKHQHPRSRDTQTEKRISGGWSVLSLRFGIFLEVGCWCLVLFFPLLFFFGSVLECGYEERCGAGADQGDFARE